MAERPVLWSFRRCPYAIRARLALAAAGRMPGEELELREVNLACRPPELLEAWPTATVPLLQLGQGELIGESLEVMRWALARHDPQRWLALPHDADRAAEGSAGSALEPLPQAMAALIAENDGPFKHHLDRFRYASRYPGEDPERHRREALRILQGWNQRLQRSASGGEPGWLLGERACLADWALLPFVRQFRLADPEAFAADSQLPALRGWLERFEAGSALAAVMREPWAPRQPWRSPRWIYHLALAQEWRQACAQGVYRRSTRGLSLETAGFIHASHADQIAATHGRFYADAGPVLLLTIDPARLAAI